jgi:hypothetical protein
LSGHRTQLKAPLVGHSSQSDRSHHVSSRCLAQLTGVVGEVPPGRIRRDGFWRSRVVARPARAWMSCSTLTGSHRLHCCFVNEYGLEQRWDSHRAWAIQNEASASRVLTESRKKSGHEVSQMCNLNILTGYSMMDVSEPSQLCTVSKSIPRLTYRSSLLKEGLVRYSGHESAVLLECVHASYR